MNIPKGQLFAMESNINVQCDNTKCDFVVYRDQSYSDLLEDETSKYLNIACPKCGENLLTQKDLDGYVLTMKVLRWMNKWLGWVSYLLPKSYFREAEISFHKGVKVTPAREKSNEEELFDMEQELDRPMNDRYHKRLN